MEVSDGAMLRISGEQEAPLVMSPKPRHRKQRISVIDLGEAGPSEVGFSDTSTPVESVLPNYSQQKSSLLNCPEILMWTVGREG